MSTCTDIFTDIYARRVWGEGSGGGSDPEQAKPYLWFINRWMELHRPRLILDIGVGDGRIFKGLRIPVGSKYVGIDVIDVKPLIEENKGAAFYAAFKQADATEYLPPADLVLCKEVLQHLSLDLCEKMLTQMGKSKVCLVTSLSEPLPGTNIEIETGDCRPIDLSLSPFSRKAVTLHQYNHGSNHLHIQQVSAHPGRRPLPL